MSTPTSSAHATPTPSAMAPTALPPPNGAQSDSASSGGTGDTQHDVSRVIAFNHAVTELFEDPQVRGPNSIELVLDHSGSISGPNALLLRTAVAAMTNGTNAHKKFVIPKPSGTTGIINAIHYCKTNDPKNGTIYLFTDGAENCFSGNLVVGKESDGSPKVAFFNGGNATMLADHLQHLEIRVCILGIGDAAKPMVKEMIGRKNVFCGHIDHGADTRAIVSVVRTLKRVSKGGQTSVTRNGTQHALLVSLNPEVQESIKNLTPAEMDELDIAIGGVIIAGTDIVAPSDLKRHMEQVFDNYDEDIAGHEKDIRAGLLLAMEAMCDEPMPAALISSKHSAVIGVPGGWRDFGRHCNRLFSRFAAADIVHRAPAVGNHGKIVHENGEQHKFSKGCAQYTCDIPKSAITGLAESAEYCTERAKLPAPNIKKRKRVTFPPAAPNQRRRAVARH